MTPKSTKKAVAGALLLGTVGTVAAPVTALAAPNTTDEAVTDFALSWRGAETPENVLRGGTLTASLQLNANDADGEDGTEDRTVELTVTNGRFLELPKQADPEGSKIAEDGRSATVVVKGMEKGSAITLDLPVAADGTEGDKIQITGVSNNIEHDTAEVPIATKAGVNARFNWSPNRKAWYNITAYDGNHVQDDPLPLSIQLPPGSEDLDPNTPIEFDITIESTENPYVVQNDILTAGGFTSSKYAPGTEKVGALPETRIEFKGNGVYHVTMTGFQTEALKQVEKGATGTALSLGNNYTYMVNGMFTASYPLKDALGKGKTTLGYTATLSNLVVKDSTGRALPEDSAEDNQVGVTKLPNGTGRANWSRYAQTWETEFTQDETQKHWLVVGDAAQWDRNAVSRKGQGSYWSGAARVLAGEHLWAEVLGVGHADANVFVIPKNAVFDGDVALFAKGDDDAVIDSKKISYTTDPIADPATVDYDSLNWVDSPPSDLSTVTAVKGSWEGEIDSTSFSQLLVSVQAKPGAPSGTGLWAIGATHWTRDGGQWHRGGGNIQTIEGQEYPGTHGYRDYAQVVGTNVTSNTEFTKPAIDPGQENELTVTGAINAGIDVEWTGKIKVETTLAPGVEYVSADVEPTSVTEQEDGSTLLTWDQVDATAGQDVVRKVVVKGTGDERATNGYFAKSKTVNLSTNPSDSATAQEATSKADFAISFDGKTQLVKVTEQATTKAQSGKPQNWRLTVSNTDSISQPVTDVIDVLPANGDTQGSKFSGNYTIGDVNVEGVENPVVYYTTADPATLSSDPNDASNGAFAAPSDMWSTTKPEDASTITGVRVVTGKLGIGKTYTINVPWTPADNHVDDVYVNIAGARATTTKLLMLNSARSNVISDGSVLKVHKEALPSDKALVPGGEIAYKVEVFNDSDNEAYNVHFLETPGDQIDPESVVLTDMSQGTADGRSWELGTLAPHTKATAIVKAKLVDSWNGEDILNQVNVSNPSNPPKATCDPNDTVEGDTDQCDVTTTSENYNLQIDKTAITKVGELRAGGDVEHVLTVRNAGPDAAKEVYVEDLPGAAYDPDTMQYVDGTASQGTVEGKRWNIGTLEAGQEATIHVKGKLTGNWRGEPVNNMAMVGNPRFPTPEDGDPDNPTCQVNDDVQGDTDRCDVVSLQENSELKLSKTLDTDRADFKPGGDVTYTVTAKNTGTDPATNVQVKDNGGKALQTETVQFVDGTASQGEIVDGVWNVGTLEPGQEVTIKVTGKLVEDWRGEVVNNAALVESPWHPINGDPGNPDDFQKQRNATVDEDTDQEDAVATAVNGKLQIDKTLASDRGNFGPGAEVEYDVTVKNSGPDAVPAVTVTDNGGAQFVPGSVQFVDGSASQGEIVDGVWRVGELAGDGGTATVRVKGVLVDTWAGEDVNNAVLVESPWVPLDGEPGDPDNFEFQENPNVDEDTDQRDVVKTSEKSVLKIDKDFITPANEYGPGKDISYRITVRNDGPDDAAGVKVQDRLGKVFKADSVKFTDPSQGDSDGGTWNVGTLPVGAEATVTVTGTLNDDWAGEDVNNLAVVFNPFNPIKGDGDPDNPGDTCQVNDDVTGDTDQCDVVSLRENPMLQVDKALDTKVDGLAPGSEVVYTVTAKNASPDETAHGVYVTELPGAGLVPDSVEFMDSTQSMGTLDGKLVWKVGDLKPGETATIKVKGILADDVYKLDGILNDVDIRSIFAPGKPDGGQINETVDEDEDRWDSVVFKVTEPPAPETPPTPEQPPVAAPPVKPAPPSDPPVTARTGASGLEGDGSGYALGGVLAALAAAVGIGGWKASRRKGEQS